MLGYQTYLDKSMNGIRTISDGTAIIQNGSIQANNISTSQIDTSHINSSTGSFDTFTIDNLAVNQINNVTDAELETLTNINTSTTIQAQLNNKANLNTNNNFTGINEFENDVIMETTNTNFKFLNLSNRLQFYDKNLSVVQPRLNISINEIKFMDASGNTKSSVADNGAIACSQINFIPTGSFDYNKYLDLARKSQSNTFTASQTFTSIQGDTLNLALSGSIGTISVPFMATQNNHIATKKFVDDEIINLNASTIPRLNANNVFTGSLNTFSNSIAVGSEISVGEKITFTSNTTTPGINSTSSNSMIITSANNTNLYINNDKPVSGNLYLNTFSPNSHVFIDNGNLNIVNGNLTFQNGNVDLSNNSILTVPNTAVINKIRVNTIENYTNGFGQFLDIKTITRRTDWRHYSIERKMVLAYMFIDEYRLYPLLCSMRRLPVSDDDNYYILEPGVKIEIYDGLEYDTLQQTFNNTNGTAPQYYVKTTSPNDGASCKLYYFDEEIRYPNISYIP